MACTFASFPVLPSFAWSPLLLMRAFSTTLQKLTQVKKKKEKAAFQEICQLGEHMKTAAQLKIPATMQIS